MMSTTICQWCGHDAGTVTDHMIHVTTEHPETIGRGRTMSVEWTCPACIKRNVPSVHVCASCGYVNERVHERNVGRRWTIYRRRPNGTISKTLAFSYDAAQQAIAMTPAILRAMRHTPSAVFDRARMEVRDNGSLVAWLVSHTDDPKETPT